MKRNQSLIVLSGTVATGAPGLFMLPPTVYADDFTVTDTEDSSPGSLRQAILDANKHTGADRIRFNIPGTEPHTISVGNDAGQVLPIITGTLTVDGTSQPGFAGKPIIELEAAT